VSVESDRRSDIRSGAASDFRPSKIQLEFQSFNSIISVLTMPYCNITEDHGCGELTCIL